MEPTLSQEPTVSVFYKLRQFLVAQQVTLEARVEDKIGAVETQDLLALALYSVLLAFVCASLTLYDLVEYSYDLFEYIRSNDYTISVVNSVKQNVTNLVEFVKDWYSGLGTYIEEVQEDKTEL